MSEVATSSDGRYVVIAGRRWRATDPAIPPTLATELRTALMAARRAVGADLRAVADTSSDRARVHRAKLALGERGRAWWETPTEDSARIRVTATILTLIDAREPRTACPSEIARVVGGERWRALMPTVREVATQLVGDGEMVVTQRGVVVEPPWKGPIRFRRPS